MPHAETSSPPPTTINSESSNEPKLYVNDGQLPEYGLLKPSSPSLPLTELHRRYEEDGYLFLKGLLPRPKVLTAREKYFSFMSPSGVLAPSTTPVQGIYDSSKPISQFPGIGAGAVGGNGHPGEQAATFVDLALLAHKEDWYAEDFCRMKELVDFVEYFTGWVGDVEEEEDGADGADGEGRGKRKRKRMAEFRRTLLRNSIPGTKAIGVHYDQIFLRYGEPTSVTAWVPMGDVGIQGGGLIYLENGAQLGKQFEDDFTAKAKASGLTDEQAKNAFNQNMLSTGLLADGPVEFGRTHGRRWLATDYEAGDVVLHNPYTIHASTINHDPDNVIRLATDIRFVDSSRPWDQRWNKTYELNDGV